MQVPLVPLVKVPAVAPPVVAETAQPEVVNLTPAEIVPESIIGPAWLSSASLASIAVPFRLRDGKLAVVPPNWTRLKLVPALFLTNTTPSDGDVKLDWPCH